MRDHTHHIQVCKEQAVEIILSSCQFSPAVEEVPVVEALGRVLAVDALAQIDKPNALTCSMDSIAVHWDDFAELEGEVPDVTQWQRGREWEFANTGVAMPAGFDTAIVVENVVFDEADRIVRILSGPSRRFAGTRPAGSDFEAGSVLVDAGTVVTPLLAAHIASGSNETVSVLAKPKVAFIPTGNELVALGEPVRIGKNIETNSIMMKGKIEQWGGEAILYPITPDDPVAIEAALRKAADEADIVVLNAGSSKGSDDWSLEILERIGTVRYHQTNHGPGHHSSFSLLDGTPVIGISGPPGGAAFTTDFYLRPAMQKYLGQDPWPVKVTARLAQDFPAGGHSGPGKAQHVEAKPSGETRPREGGVFFGIKQMKMYPTDEGLFTVYPASSSHPSPMEAEDANVYYALKSGPGIEAPKAGDLISVYLRPYFI